MYAFFLVKLHFLVNPKEIKDIKLYFQKENFDTELCTINHHCGQCIFMVIMMKINFSVRNRLNNYFF